MPPVVPLPTRSRLRFPSEAVQQAVVRNSMLPEMTVQPVIEVSPIGSAMLHGSAVNVPISNPPFWNGVADADAAKTTANRTERMRLIVVLLRIFNPHTEVLGKP